MKDPGLKKKEMKNPQARDMVINTMCLGISTSN